MIKTRYNKQPCTCLRGFQAGLKRELHVIFMLPAIINFHGCVALLPIVLIGSKPSKIPQNLVSGGDHIKKKQIELNLLQIEVARQPE